MDSIAISEAAVSDAEGILAVQTETWLATYPNPDIGITTGDIQAKTEEMNARGFSGIEKRITESKTSKLWVAKHEDRVVGFIRIDKSEQKNILRALYILPAYQRQGIGKKLVAEAFQWLDKDKNVVLEVASYNAQAITFYKSLGFIENGSTVNEVGNLPGGKVIPEIEMIRNERR